MRIVKSLIAVSVVISLTGCNTNSTEQKMPQTKAGAQLEVEVLPKDEKVDNEVEKLDDEVSKEENLEVAEQDKETIEITEKMYVSYINEMYMNTEEYEGKKIKLEGMFTSAYDEATKQMYYFVYRTGPGCCNNDGSMCGLEFTTADTIPVENDWIEVIGTLESYEENGFTYLTLRDSKVTIKAERGQEVVYQ